MNAGPKQPLFRKEVFKHRIHRLHGNVSIALPMRWQVIGWLFFGIVVTASLFLSLAGYSRIETVAGMITPEGGIAQIVPTRAGIIARIPVQAGQKVEKGAALAIISTDESLAGGATSADQILDSLDTQEQGLSQQEAHISASAVAERARLSARISGLEAEVTGLRDRIGIQDGLVRSARGELEAAQSIAERGFISRRDILQREESWLSREQQLSQLRQTLATQQASIREAGAAMRESDASFGAQVAALSGQRSDIAQRRTVAAASRAFRLEAPIVGTVTALTAREGQAVSPPTPIMVIVPDRSELHAELFVSSSALGFLEVGQEVALALDAFPYQRFGTTPARITAIAAAPIGRSDAEGSPIPVYIVTASLERKQLSAYGSRKELIAGMTLTARIITEKQSLFEWLFEPLFAVGRR